MEKALPGPVFRGPELWQLGRDSCTDQSVACLSADGASTDRAALATEDDANDRDKDRESRFPPPLWREPSVDQEMQAIFERVSRRAAVPATQQQPAVWGRITYVPNRPTSQIAMECEHRRPSVTTLDTSEVLDEAERAMLAMLLERRMQLTKKPRTAISVLEFADEPRRTPSPASNAMAANMQTSQAQRGQIGQTTTRSCGSTGITAAQQAKPASIGRSPSVQSRGRERRSSSFSSRLCHALSREFLELMNVGCLADNHVFAAHGSPLEHLAEAEEPPEEEAAEATAPSIDLVPPSPLLLSEKPSRVSQSLALGRLASLDSLYKERDLESQSSSCSLQLLRGSSHVGLTAPPTTAAEAYVPPLDEIKTYRTKLQEQSRINFELERNLRELDKRIALLINHRITVEDIDSTSLTRSHPLFGIGLLILPLLLPKD